MTCFGPVLPRLPARFALSRWQVVVAGAMEPFEIYVWSLQTGRLLDVLTGHEAPVSCLAFSPTEPLLASGSWDKTAKIWDL